jgi:hypothetical protein
MESEAAKASMGMKRALGTARRRMATSLLVFNHSARTVVAARGPADMARHCETRTKPGGFQQDVMTQFLVEAVVLFGFAPARKPAQLDPIEAPGDE